MTRSIHINGKFLGQKSTGVQRYAANIVRHVDDLLADGHAPDLDVTMLAPRRARQPAGLRAIHLRRVGESGTPLWEQSRLAGWRAPLLLCLGNTAPLLRRRKVTCIHDLNVMLAPRSYSRAFRAYYGGIIPLVVATSQVVVTVSEFSARQLADRGGARPEKLRVIPNGHEHVFDWRPERTTLDTAKLLQRPFVVVVGSRAAHKNLAVIGRIAARIRAQGITILVVGGGGGEFAAERLPGETYLDFLGVISDDDLAWLYRHARALLFPSLLEGFGIPMVEAMALGCPVVASTASSLPGVGGDAVLYAAPDQPQAWFEAAMRLVGDPQLRDDLAQRGRLRVRLFSWRRSAELYLQLLREVA